MESDPSAHRWEPARAVASAAAHFLAMRSRSGESLHAFGVPKLTRQSRAAARGCRSRRQVTTVARARRHVKALERTGRLEFHLRRVMKW